MTLPENKIVVQDVTEKIDNPREKMYNQRIKKKPFIFKGYKTELDRIKDTIRNNRYLYNLPEPEEKLKSNKTISQSTDKLILNPQINNMTYSQKYELSKSIPTTKRIVDDINLNPDLIDYLIKNDIIIQPQMRFKARTDLERVYEALSGNFYRDNEREILNRQLKSLDLFNYKKPEDFLKLTNLNNDIDKSVDEENEKTYKIKPNPIIEEFKKKEKEKNVNHLIYGNGNLFYDPRKEIYSKPWRRNMNLNSEAEGILSEYHIKTHFKACAEVAEKKINYKNLKLSRNNLHKRTYTFDNNDLNKKKILNFDEPENKINYDDYNKNENPYFLKRNETVDPASLKALSKIAFGKDSIIRGDTAVVEQYIPTGKKNKYYHKRKLVDENSVLIDGKILYKDSQFDIIANKVLNICNIYKKKI